MDNKLIDLGFSQSEVNKINNNQIKILFQYYNENEIINMDKKKILKGLNIFCEIFGINNRSIKDGVSNDSVLEKFISSMGYKEKVWALMLIKKSSPDYPEISEKIDHYTNKLKSHIAVIKDCFSEVKSGKSLKLILNDQKFVTIKKEILFILGSLKKLPSVEEVKAKLIFEIQKQPTRQIELFYLKIISAVAATVSPQLKTKILAIVKQWPIKDERQVQKQLKEKVAKNFLQ